jgi:hypothetical protein
MEQPVGGFPGIFEDRVLARRRVIPLARLCHMQQAYHKMEIGGVADRRLRLVRHQFDPVCSATAAQCNMRPVPCANPAARFVRLMHHQHRHLGTPQDMSGEAAEDPLTQPAVPIGSHNDESGLLGRRGKQGAGSALRAGWQATH